MISNGECVIVDEFTGRLMPGRRWSDGLHQAIEAKEGVEVKNENQTLASITFQNYFRMYKKLAGMTGTADTEAVEFKKIYNLDVSVIPTNRPIKRNDIDDVVYKTENAKFNAIIKEVRERFEKGQPVLIGTASIEKSELLSAALKREGVKHDVLNAKHHEREAEIISQAGRKAAITIATNMAGRGTDIVLGGNAEALAKREAGADPIAYEEAIKKFSARCEEEKKHVIQAGGLYIIGTERHESRRIDNQLRGRSGRQGDPGESKFFLSLEDNLMRIFNGAMIQKIMDRLNVPEDEPITAGMVSRSIEGAQRKVEGHNFDIRKHLLDYDNVMNQQRTIIYGMRKSILENKDLERTVLDMLGDVVSSILDLHLPQDTKREHWNLEGLNLDLGNHFGLKIDFSSFPALTQELVQESVQKAVKDAYERQKQSLGGFFEQLIKMVLLQAIDQRWKEHLQMIDRLKEGINLRGYAQKDPVIEYKKEAFKAFQSLNEHIKRETVEKLMRVQIVNQEQADSMKEMLQAPDMEELNYQGADESLASGAFRGLPQQPPPQTPPAPAATPGRMRMTAGPPSQSQQDRQMNRADRRRLDKGKR
jgi:preprotein translocase subunit SecA